ncbi:MAG: site-specific integrase [Rhodoferax sp.]
MASVETYTQLAERTNTRRSYASAVQHFEVEGRGALPATAEAIAAYLAQYAGTHSISTLRARLAGLSRWHQDHGFVDPTKAPLVSRVLKGIRAAHNAPQKQARPLEFGLMEQVSDWLKAEQNRLDPSDPRYLRTLRDQAMLLIGFWRGFRSDELTRLQFEHVSIKEGVGMQCFLPYSKGDRESAGRTFLCPALPILCPVTAYRQWKVALGKTSGPVFRGIDQWGNVSEQGLAAGSVVPWLRSLFEAAGVPDHDAYSSHSLRRGFATWAKSSGWELKELMAYVGWTDVNSALRYLELSEEDLGARFVGLMEKPPSSRLPSIASGRLRSNESEQPSSNVVALPRRPSK